MRKTIGPSSKVIFLAEILVIKQKGSILGRVDSKYFEESGKEASVDGLEHSEGTG